MRMRRSRIRGYQGYRGRGRGNGYKWLVVLLVLVLLAACAFLFAQRYVIYSSDGSMRYEWPWLRREADPAGMPAEPSSTGSETPEEVPIIIEQPSPSSQTLAPQPPAPQEPAVQEPEVPRIRELPVSVLQGSAEKTLQELEGSPINTLAVRVKNVRGELLYPSKISGAVEAQAVSGGSIARSAIEELTGSDYKTVARISALHDSIYSFAHMSDAAIQQIQYRGYIWYAPDSSFYLAPEKELARQYIADIAKECAELGFDELLFDEFGYPSTGRQSNIKTDARRMSKEDAITLLASDIRTAVGEDSEVKLSLVLDAETVLAGGNELAGQNIAALAPYFDRFYVPATAEELPALQSALAPYGIELIPIVSEPLPDGPYLLEQ